MAKLIFIRRVPSMDMEKAEGTELKANIKTVTVVGVLLLAFLGASIFLYTKDQPDAGRVIIDLTLAFFGWATGRATGEIASLPRG